MANLIQNRHIFTNKVCFQHIGKCWKQSWKQTSLFWKHRLIFSLKRICEQCSSDRDVNI